MTTKLIGITDDGRAVTPADRDDPRQAFTAALINAAAVPMLDVLKTRAVTIDTPDKMADVFVSASISLIDSLMLTWLGARSLSGGITLGMAEKFVVEARRRLAIAGRESEPLIRAALRGPHFNFAKPEGGAA